MRIVAKAQLAHLKIPIAARVATIQTLTVVLVTVVVRVLPAVAVLAHVVEVTPKIVAE